MRPWTLIAVFSAAACYHPASEQACGVSCETGVCPGDLACGSDALCHASGAADCSTVDAGSDNGPGGDGSADCLGANGLWADCDVQPNGSLSSPATLDTGTCPRPVTVDGVELCVFEYDTIKISSGETVRVTGDDPVVLVATGSITISGTLDVSSSLVNGRGAGANAGCDAQSTAGALGGGGGGGSFQGSGGTGGGDLGAEPAPMSLDHIRGGCDGGPGSGPTAAGPGGGVVYLIAGAELIVSGTIWADGGGGAAGVGVKNGGGGGGAGGLIGLAAPSVTATGMFSANGGGGGGGYGQSNDGSSSTGGADGSAGGAGGNGAGVPVGGSGGGGDSGTSTVTLDGGGGLAGQGGGGGGGGGAAGFIYIHSGGVSTGGNLRPPPTIGL